MEKLNNGESSELRRRSFLNLVEENQELASLRQEYALKSPDERRRAAEWHYDSAIASEIFTQALARAGEKPSESSDWPAGVVALAIDPRYAPVLLMVGSLEYRFGHTEQAMTLFMTLPCLPENEEDLSETIDQAGDFLIAQGD